MATDSKNVQAIEPFMLNWTLLGKLVYLRFNLGTSGWSSKKIGENLKNLDVLLNWSSEIWSLQK